MKESPWIYRHVGGLEAARGGADSTVIIYRHVGGLEAR
ncbi:hypothetical protein CCP3SC15_940007 [Gammaproteobacteria bacterium]